MREDDKFKDFDFRFPEYLSEIRSLVEEIVFKETHVFQNHQLYLPYYDKYTSSYYKIGDYLIEYVGRENFNEWTLPYYYGIKNKYEALPFNILLFIKHFNISKEELFDAFTREKNSFLTVEQIEALYTDDQNIIDSAFVNKCSIYHNGNIYTPDWLFTHGIEDYKKEGISLEKIKAKFDIWENRSSIAKLVKAVNYEEYKNMILAELNKE